jgi:hypothetical protein
MIRFPNKYQVTAEDVRLVNLAGTELLELMSSATPAPGVVISDWKLPPSLKALKLGGWPVSDGDVGVLCARHPKLERLHLTDVSGGVSDTQLAQLLRTMKGLKWLNLNGTKGLTDQSLGAVGSVQNLLELHVADTRFTKRALDALVDARKQGGLRPPKIFTSR